MPIESPQLDDLRFDRLVEELKRRIPVYAAKWTDHNDSDPGITLIQLFAYLAEQVGYRLNQVPEKNYIELLKLLGIRLKPPHAATTRLALILGDAGTLEAFPLKAPAQAKAKKGNPPPVFETDTELSVVPCEVNTLLTTKNPYLNDVLKTDGPREVSAIFPATPADDTDWLSVRWDGKKPALKDMPTGPIVLAPDSPRQYLWIGLSFNSRIEAGFRGVQVTLTVQFDDDEQPSLTAVESCGLRAAGGETPDSINWLAYYDAVHNAFSSVPGRIDDSTNQFRRSGELRFTVPDDIGPIPDDQWKPLQKEQGPSAIDACRVFSKKLAVGFGDAKWTATPPKDVAKKYKDAIALAEAAVDRASASMKKLIVHPLRPNLRGVDRVRGWLRITLPAFDGPSPKLRMLTFNTVRATQATVVANELVGISDGRPGQSFRLAHGNVLPDSLKLAIQEGPTGTDPLVSWTPGDLDAAGPFDSVFDLDPEAGTITFGDGRDPQREGRGGRIPPLVPGLGRIIAMRYQFGGGKAGEVDVGAIQTLDSPANGIKNAVNFVAARGGRDAETLEEAKLRARRELSTRSRAVTASDFEWIALQTPDVRVARVQIIPLRAPQNGSSQIANLIAGQCGSLPVGPAGLDGFTAFGAVAVVVVPDVQGAEPLPTPSFLTAVCRYLDLHRLVTTEVFVVPPQYVRLCRFEVSVKAKPGYKRAGLQDLVEARLSGYLHVLTGGLDGQGFSFGDQLHIADLIAQVLRTEGVERVESLSACFSRTKSNTDMREGRLVLCPAAVNEIDHVTLAPEENVSFDRAGLRLITVD